MPFVPIWVRLYEVGHVPGTRQMCLTKQNVDIHGKSLSKIYST